MFRSICQLSPNDWSGWELHSELDEILALSRKLHSDQKNWLKEAHWRPKGDGILLIQNVRFVPTCLHLNFRCVQCILMQNIRMGVILEDNSC